jgi:putative membrane protein
MIKFLPSLNALFNALSFLFLLLGFVNIKKKNVEAHKKFMLSAFVSSSLFLVGYLTYHYSAGVTRFKETGFWRIVYLTILTSHTLIAVFVLPMAIVTLVFALLKKFDKHPK